MFNDDLMAVISIASQQNHLKMLLQIREQVILNADYKVYLDKVIIQETEDYLDSYGGDLKEQNV